MHDPHLKGITMTNPIEGAERADDAAVVGIRATNDYRSFDDFCRTNHTKVMRALALALRDPDLGRDAANEAFARAWQRWGSVSQMTNPQGWVYRVGLNWGRSFLRRIRREVSTSTTDLDERVVEDQTVDPAFAQAVSKLSPDHRAVLVAKFYLDWSESEIATALKIPAGTVKSRLSRAIENLARSTHANQ